MALSIIGPDGKPLTGSTAEEMEREGERLAHLQWTRAYRSKNRAKVRGLRERERRRKLAADPAAYDAKLREAENRKVRRECEQNICAADLEYRAGLLKLSKAAEARGDWREAVELVRQAAQGIGLGSIRAARKLAGLD